LWREVLRDILHGSLLLSLQQRGLNCWRNRVTVVNCSSLVYPATASARAAGLPIPVGKSGSRLWSGAIGFSFHAVLSIGWSTNGAAISLARTCDRKRHTDCGEILQLNPTCLRRYLRAAQAMDGVVRNAILPTSSEQQRRQGRREQEPATIGSRGGYGL